MNHEQVRDWIDEAFATPDARAADDAAARQARAHLATCPECAANDEATRRAALKLDLARGPSPEVRTRLLAAARRTRLARRDALSPAKTQPWWQRPLAWRLAAAGLVLAVVGAAGGAWWAGANAPHDNDAEHLAQAVAMMATLAADHHSQEVVLRNAAGNTNGFAVVSAVSHQMAMFATHLSAGVGYHCYVERAGARTWVGTMYATPGVEFWAGDMDSAIEMQPGDLLVVAADETQPAVLSAPL